MYSVVLLAALTTTPAAQGWHRGGHSGYGTHYFGASCFYSYGCYGRFGGGHVNYGYYGCYGCYGTYGCSWYGGGYTSGSFGYGAWQCNGCYGTCSSYGYAAQQTPVESAPPSSAPGKGPTPQAGKNYETAPPPRETKDYQEQARAKVIVDLPADAKLYVDGQLMNTTSARRMFQTPTLAPGQLYYYELKAEVIRDGRTVTANQRVILRPGEAATASFAELGGRRDATAEAGQQ